MSAPGSDSLGLGGLGTSALNGGFGPGSGPGGGLAEAVVDLEEAAESAVAKAEAVVDAAVDKGRNNNRRGPYNGQYASFGNRRRTAAAYRLHFREPQNSALNAAPYSLNGQSAPKPSYYNTNFGVNVGGPMVIPKIVNWPRASFYFTYQGTV